MAVRGSGIPYTIVLDAALVRTVLVPAAMRIAGTGDWWIPRRLAPVVARVRLRE
ncbi:hypothetical protein [Nocardia niwae]|uniref:Uncharacterized protein n=1 Tax=Nocardia niwae TaxID=626084 RepID=A0ABV2X5S1_9NOCA|nr:hypothetical protein [Nocardia niwae]